ncbi:2'-deoxynucleoside 5'-phosphate N-hydrolase 1-like [Puntigrus tetrazona]|uniref:2'-deoxynucleoside 5'-phosphate N-hydrolase 1-like n=1 Tax=Puntigrus tetrazona TaxID=1606681 RepID=UPI001C89E82C|nr:2'-deoxynucleoside 5'-phosphate N-hydrolase 1-like [Puntigrus tetrazona]
MATRRRFSGVCAGNALRMLSILSGESCSCRGKPLSCRCQTARRHSQSMNIYFCGSIRGGRQDVNVYQRIVKKLQRYGTVLTEHVSSGSLSEKGEDAALGGDKAIHDRDVEWLMLSDVIVAEVTQPSLGVGYELGRAAALNKRVFCLFRPSSGKVLSAMIRGASANSLFQVQDYTEEEVESVLEKYFEGIAKNR